MTIELILLCLLSFVGGGFIGRGIGRLIVTEGNIYQNITYILVGILVWTTAYILF